jgi:demethylmenaquinone methyltransferase/2-methoxy-6-polyprenyl-1,4-benzoquinol methylase
VGDDEALIAEQIEYYRARAGEYDQVYAVRQDVRDLLALAGEMPVGGEVLELACGTGQWTRLLAERARTVTAVDAAPEALAIARERVPSEAVRFVRADLFDWQPERRYDTVFFAFWLSHVPPARLPAFWRTVAAALVPGGRAVFVDDGPGQAAAENVLDGTPVPAVRRRLDDGREYRVVKVFHDMRRLVGQLAELGWTVDVRSAGGEFIVGVAEPGAGRGAG